MKVVLASSNQGKIKEFKSLFANMDIELISQAELNIQEAIETGKTFVENALIKARHASRLSNLPALADDSGLVVPSLHGEPGIFSARYADTNPNPQNNIEKLLQKLEQQPNRYAYFYCALLLINHPDDPTPLISQAKWPGEIAKEAHGEGGFGYDPVFFVTSENKTAADLPAEIKNQISHRGQALQQLKSRIKEKLDERTIS